MYLIMYLTNWLLELFSRNAYILEIFRLDMCQTSFNLLKKAFATWQYAYWLFRHFFFFSGMRRNRNFKILDEKLTFDFRLFFFLNFVFRLSFFSFSYFFAADSNQFHYIYYEMIILRFPSSWNKFWPIICICCILY